MKKKYFINGFFFIGKAVEQYLPEYKIDYSFPKPSRNDFITNFLLVKKLVRKGELKKYDVVHMCTWETILAYKKERKDQVFIAHSHGFGPGLNFNTTVVELPFVRRQLARVLEMLIDKKMRRKIISADIYYVSTPNMLEHALKLRKDAVWLPNPIDQRVFNANGEIKKLEGNPSVFLPTRLHVFKNPLFGVNLFKKIKKKYPKAKLHVINYAIGADPLFNEFMNKVIDKDSCIVHPRLPRNDLPKLYRGADIVLGQFNPKLGNLSLVELEAMACGAPLVTLDKYEIKTSLDSLEKLAFKIIKDKKFRDKYVKKNIDYINKVHSEKAVAKTFKKILSRKK